ncbi:TPA: IS1634 family transposase, partial [Streptococcus suis]
VFYDVTNYYFETDIPDSEEVSENGTILKEGLRRRGPSKEHRPKPIVQLGLFMDTNGIPISYKLFRGNQTDPVTYLPAVEEVKKQFGIERIVVVADKAMNSQNNVSAMEK